MPVVTNSPGVMKARSLEARAWGGSGLGSFKVSFDRRFGGLGSGGWQGVWLHSWRN